MYLKKDKFIQSLLGVTSYLILIDSKLNKNDLVKKVTKSSFYTLKSRYAIPNTVKKKIEADLICKHITFKKSYEKLSDSVDNCRLAKKSDYKQLKNISLEQTSSSHFVQDKKLPIRFRKNFRFNWLSNFFKRKRGDFLIVYEKKMIEGFLLLIKKDKSFIIDLIVTSKKKRKSGVARSLINFVNNNYLKKNNSPLIAGTQSNNFSAIRFYSKMNFKKTYKQYIYHIHKISYLKNKNNKV